jgi:hypothetical protein
MIINFINIDNISPEIKTKNLSFLVDIFDAFEIWLKATLDIVLESSEIDLDLLL